MCFPLQPSDDYVIMRHDFYQQPDAVQIYSGQDLDESMMEAQVTYGGNFHGDFFIEPLQTDQPTNNTYTVQALGKAICLFIDKLFLVIILELCLNDSLGEGWKRG